MTFHLPDIYDTPAKAAERKAILDDAEKPKPRVFLERNNPIPMLLRVVGGLHIGDREVALAHLLSAHSLGLSTDPISLYTIGSSGKGKSHVAQSVLEIMPRENTLVLASFSPKVFHYAANSKTRDFSKLIIHSPELSIDKDDEEKLALLRLLTDNGQTRKACHFTLGPNREILELKLEGRSVLWFNSVSAIHDEQLKNRLILLNPDESEQQDRAVNEFQVRTLGLGEPAVSDQDLDFASKINQDILQSPAVRVIIPFADFLGFPPFANRRLLPVFLQLIGAAARMNVFRRMTFKVGDSTILLAEPEDLLVADAAWAAASETTVSQVSRAALDLLPKFPRGRDARQDKVALGATFGISSSRAYQYARELSAAGLVDFEAEGRVNFYWIPHLVGVVTNSSRRDETALNGFYAQTQAFYEKRLSLYGEACPREYMRRALLPENRQKNFLEWLNLASGPPKMQINS